MHRGFGFVTFAEEEDAENAIDNMHLNELRGVRRRGAERAHTQHVLTVNIAKPQKVALEVDAYRPVWETEVRARVCASSHPGVSGEIRSRRGGRHKRR